MPPLEVAEPVGNLPLNASIKTNDGAFIRITSPASIGCPDRGIVETHAAGTNNYEQRCKSGSAH